MMEAKRILLAEDDPRDAELTLTALDEFNLANEVVTVHDGEQALDYLFKRGRFAGRASGNPAVVLIDLKMPKVDGLQVLQAIRSDEQLKLLPVVILTSSREQRDLVRGYELGVNAYVVKPVQFQDFIQAVKNLGLFWAIVNESPTFSMKRT